MSSGKTDRDRAVVIIRCGQFRLGVSAQRVRTVVAAPALTPLPAAPPVVAGLISLHGRPLPVLDLSCRTGTPASPVGLDSRIVIVDTRAGPCGLLCDGVDGVQFLAATAWQSLEPLAPGAGYLAAGTAGAPDIVILQDPDLWLDPAERDALLQALVRRREEESLP